MGPEQACCSPRSQSLSRTRSRSALVEQHLDSLPNSKRPQTHRPCHTHRHVRTTPSACQNVEAVWDIEIGSSNAQVLAGCAHALPRCKPLPNRVSLSSTSATQVLVRTRMQATRDPPHRDLTFSGAPQSLFLS